MKRRDFLKLLVASGGATIISVRAAEEKSDGIPEFNPKHQYGNFVCIFNGEKRSAALNVLYEDAIKVVPKKFRNGIRFLERHSEYAHTVAWKYSPNYL